MVLSAKIISDVLQRYIRQLFAEIHGHLPRDGNLARTLACLNIRQAYIVKLTDNFLYTFYAYRPVIVGNNVL